MKSLKVIPCNPMYHASNGRRGYSKSNGKRLPPELRVPEYVNRSYLSNLIRSKAAEVIAFPMGTSALFRHVFHVVRVRPGEYVRWIAARPVVAPMASALIRRHIAVGQDVSNTVRLVDSRFFARPNSNVTISTALRPLPLPTIIGTANVNLRPESIADVLRNFISGKLSGLHGLTSYLGPLWRRARSVDALPGVRYRGLYSHAH